MTLPFNPLLTDRQFGPRANPVNPFDRRSGSVYTKPLAPVKITAKRPTWSDVKSGSVGAASTALGTRAMPNVREVAEDVRAKARAAYARGGTADGGTLTQEMYKRAAQADILMGSMVGGATDPMIIGKTVEEASRQFGDIASGTGTTLSQYEAGIPAVLGGLAGGTAAFMTGSRLLTGGLAAAGRAMGATRAATGVATKIPTIGKMIGAEEAALAATRAAVYTGRGAKLANIGKTIERARDARNTEGSIRAALKAKDLSRIGASVRGAGTALGKRGAAELLPAVPINLAQGALDKEGGETSAMAADALGYKGLAASIRERKGRVAGMIENQAMDFVGFGVMESLAKAVRMKITSGTEIGSTAAGALVGAATDEEDRLRGAGVGAVAGLVGARGGAIGLSQRIVGDARVPILVNGMDVSVPAPFKAKSAGLEAIAKAPQEKGDAGYWAGVLAKGTRKAELEDSRFNEWLGEQKGTLTKVEVANALRERLPVLGTADRGYGVSNADLRAEYESVSAERHADYDRHLAHMRDPESTEGSRAQSLRQLRDFEDRAMQALKRFSAGMVPTHHASYTVPGSSTDYSELVTTAEGMNYKVGDKIEALYDGDWEIAGRQDDGSFVLRSVDKTEETVMTAKELDKALVWERKNNFTAPYHWPGVKNPIAHTRIDERVINGERVLMVRESQSDAHQTAREINDFTELPRGYRTRENERAHFEAKAQSDAIGRDIRRVGQAAEAAQLDAVANDPKVAQISAEIKEVELALQKGSAALADEYRAIELQSGRVPDDFEIRSKAGYDFRRIPEGLGLVRQHKDLIDAHFYAERLAEPKAAKDPEVVALWEQHTALKRQQSEIDVPNLGEVPDLPFKKTLWTELNLKRILEHAANRGVSRVVLPTGRQAADMFSMRKVADKMEYKTSPTRESGDLLLYRNGRWVETHSVKKTKLASYVGRDVANRLLADGVVEGEGLEAGAEGMKGYYEVIVPNVIKDYAKKLGVKIDVEKVGSQSADKKAVQETLARLNQRAEDAQRELRDAEYARTQIGARDWQLVDEANARIRRARVAVTEATLESAKATQAMLRDREKAANSLSDNLSFRMTPELKAAVEAGQPLYAMGAASLLGDERDDRSKVGSLAALAIGSMARRPANARAARLMRSAFSTNLGVITQEAQSNGGRFGHVGTAGGKATFDQMRALNRDVDAVLTEGGRDRVGEIVEMVLGRPSRIAETRETRGVWNSAIAPNRSIEVQGDDEAVRVRAAIHGIIEGQDAVAWHRFVGENPVEGAGEPKNYGATITGRDFGGLTDDQLSAFFQMRSNPRYDALLMGATESGGHLLIRNFGELDPDDFVTRLKEAASLAGIGADLHTGYFAGELLEGRGAYLRAVGRQPDALREIRNLVSSLQPVYAKHGQAAGVNAAEITERMARLNTGLESLEGQIRAPKPATNASGTTVPVAMEKLSSEIASRYGRIVGDKDVSANAINTLEGRLRVEIEALVHDLGLTEQEIKDWYSGGARLLRDIASLSLPTLHDDDHWTVFTAISSVLSSGQKVNDEIRSAMNVWAQFEENDIDGLSLLSLSKEGAEREYSTASSRAFSGVRARGIGTEVGGREAVALSQRTINHEAFLSDLRGLLRRDGIAKVAKQLREGRLYVFKGKKNERSYPIALDVIGPKTGQYFLDKLGIGGEGSTIDLWMARLYHALRGETKLRNVTAEDIEKAKKTLKTKALIADMSDDEIDALRTLAKSKVGAQVLDDTVTPAMREVMQRVLQGIAKDFDAQPSSAQALAWYAIKRMVAKAGAREDANAYATLGTAAADATTVTRTPAVPKGLESLDSRISMGPQGGQPGWSYGKSREEAFGLTGRSGSLNPTVAGALAGAGTGAVVGSVAGAYGDRAIGDDESTREGATAGLLAGMLAGSAGGAMTLRRFPALLGGRTGATLATSSPAVAKVLKSIATGERDLAPPPSLFGSGVAQAANRAYAAIIDDVWALRKLGRDVSGDAPLSGLDAQLRQSTRWQTWGSQRVTADLKPVLQMAKGREGDVMVLLKARRDIQLRTQGAADKSEFTMQELFDAANDASSDPKTVAAADAVQAYYRRLLDWKLDEKLLTPEAHAAIVASEDYYTPFLREWDQEQMSGGGAGFMAGGKTFNKGKGVRKMDREQRARAKTTDPFEIAVLDTFKTAQLVGKQRVMQMVSAMVEANGGEIPNVLKRVSRSDRPDPLGRRIEAIVNGELATYEVLDPDVLKALSSFGPKTQVPALLRMVKEFKRATITSLPDFMVRNLLRDNAQVALGNPVSGRAIAGGTIGGAALGAASAYGEEGDDVWAKAAYRAIAGAGLGSGGGVLLPQMWRTMRGVTDIMAASDSPLTAFVGRTTGGNSSVWNDFLTDGAASIGHYARDANDARRVIRTLRGDRSPAGAFINPKRWWQAMEAMGSTLENAPRLATYKTSLQTNPGDRALAAARAADVSLDFSRKGGSSFQQGLNETNAFFNARLQGWDKLGRMAKDPRTWAVGFATLTAPSIGNWMMIHADEESRESYYEHPSWVRNTFWLVPTGGGEFVYIPKPFELGTIFATIPERMLDWAYTSKYRGDARPGESAGNTARELLSSTVAVEAPLTDFAKPLLEQSMNYDMFRNRPIVSSETYSSAKTLPEFQQDDETSKVAKLLGERFGLSPQRIDHLVGAYGGSAGKIAMRAGNSLLPGEDVSRTAGRMPVVGDLVAGFTDRKGTTSDDEVTVRRRFERVQRVDNALRPLMKVAEDEAADPMKRDAARRTIGLLMEREAKTVGEGGQDMDGLTIANDALTKLREAARDEQRDRTLSREERTSRLEALAKYRARVARAAAAGRYDEVAAIMAELEGEP